MAEIFYDIPVDTSDYTDVNMSDVLSDYMSMLSQQSASEPTIDPSLYLGDISLPNYSGGISPSDYPLYPSFLDYTPPNVGYIPSKYNPISLEGVNPLKAPEQISRESTSGYDPSNTSGPGRYDPSHTVTPTGDPKIPGENVWYFGGSAYYNIDEYFRAVNDYYEHGIVNRQLPAGMVDWGNISQRQWTNPDTGEVVKYTADLTDLDKSEASRLAGLNLLQDQLWILERQEQEARNKALKEQFNKPLEDDFAQILDAANKNIVTDKDKWGKVHWDTHGRAEGRTFTDDFGDYVDQYPDLLEAYNKYVEDPYHDQRGFFNIRFLTPGE